VINESWLSADRREFLRADKSVAYGEVLALIDDLRATGFGSGPTELSFVAAIRYFTREAR
jgi:hypothetical protein